MQTIPSISYHFEKLILAIGFVSALKFNADLLCSFLHIFNALLLVQADFTNYLFSYTLALNDNPKSVFYFNLSFKLPGTMNSKCSWFWHKEFAPAQKLCVFLNHELLVCSLQDWVFVLKFWKFILYVYRYDALLKPVHATRFQKLEKWSDAIVLQNCFWVEVTFYISLFCSIWSTR